MFTYEAWANGVLVNGPTEYPAELPDLSQSGHPGGSISMLVPGNLFFAADDDVTTVVKITGDQVMTEVPQWHAILIQGDCMILEFDCYDAPVVDTDTLPGDTVYRLDGVFEDYKRGGYVIRLGGGATLEAKNIGS